MGSGCGSTVYAVVDGSCSAEVSCARRLRPGICSRTPSDSCSTHGCCPWCEVTPGGLRDTSSATPWRKQRLEHWGIIARLRCRGLVVCPLFGSPSFRCAMMRPDWLRIAGFGVGADWIGHLLRHLLALFAGRTKAERWSRLRDRVRELYGGYPCDSKFANSFLSHCIWLENSWTTAT